MTSQISLQHITKRFTDEVVFEDLNATFDAEHIYIITGENGAGKTTLLNIISGYTNEFEGQVNRGSLQIGYLLQSDLLFRNLTVRENLELETIAIDGCINVGEIQAVAHKMHIESFLEKPVSQLSGGEKKRVALAQILLKQSDVVLLDEPTANLQKDYAKELIEEALLMFKNKILIISTHDDVIDNRDEVVRISLKKGVLHYGT